MWANQFVKCLWEKTDPSLLIFPAQTRDTIEEYVNMGGFYLKIIDKAGIRDTSDLVENRLWSVLGDYPQRDLVLLFWIFLWE